MFFGTHFFFCFQFLISWLLFNFYSIYRNLMPKQPPIGSHNSKHDESTRNFRPTAQRNINSPLQTLQTSLLLGIYRSTFPFLPPYLFNPFMAYPRMMQAPHYFPNNPYQPPRNLPIPPHPYPLPYYHPPLPPSQSSPPRLQPVPEESPLEVEKSFNIENKEKDEEQQRQIREKKESSISPSSSKKIKNSSQPKKRPSLDKKQSKEKPINRILPHKDPYSPKKYSQHQLSTRSLRYRKSEHELQFIELMKEKSQKDLRMKIGKQHQASIPKLYLNTNESFLKMKLQKKKSLLDRMNFQSSQGLGKIF